MKRFFRKNFVYQILLIVLVMTMPIVEAPTPYPDKLLFFENPYLEIDFIVHFAAILFAYINYYILIPRLFHTYLKLQYIGTIIFLFILFCCIPWVLENFLLPNNKEEASIRMVLQLRHVFYLFISTFLFSLISSIDTKRRKAEAERAIAQIHYLKFQLNPHYLFNALNSIYGLTKSNPTEAGQAILDLSSSMRWLLDTGTNLFQPITNTIEGIGNYVKMQKRRFGDSIEVIFEVEGDPLDYQIPPMLFLPFTENAFKYGINPAIKSKIIIQMKFDGPYLTLHYENDDYSKLVDGKFSTKVGIENTLSRLDHFYNGNYKLDYGPKNGKYYVDLFMRLERAK